MNLKNASLLAPNVTLLGIKDSSGFTKVWGSWNESEDSSYVVVSGKKMVVTAPVMLLNKHVRFKDSDQTPAKAIPQKKAAGFWTIGRFNLYRLGSTIFAMAVGECAADTSIAVPAHLDFRG